MQQREQEPRREQARGGREESHSKEEGQPEKRPKTERSDTKTEAAGGENK